MRIKKFHFLLIILVSGACVLPFQARVRRAVVALIQVVKGKKTMADRLEQYGNAVRIRLAPSFGRTGVAYPPQKAKLVGFKTERIVEVWVSGPDGQWKHLKNYPILGMSGALGPKLREGDMQVPEGFYRVESLNPNSLYHLALRINYPNPEDFQRARQDGRTDLGSDIMIHGKNCSVGCLAMGDEAAEDLFVLAAETGIDNVSILLSPVDFRTRDLPADMPPVPGWTDRLYNSIRQELKDLGTQTESQNK